MTERAISFCSLPEGARVLDVGCGSGATIEYLIARHGLEAVGLDRSTKLITAGLERNTGLPFVLGNGERIPLVNGQMDVVLAECTLSLMDGPDRALFEFHRVLHPGGYLIVTDIYARQPENAFELNKLPLSSCLSGALPRQELDELVKKNHFKILLWEDHTAALKRLAAQLIMAHGSMESFWRCMAPSDGKSSCIQQAVTSARPGYFLLIAKALPTLG